MKKGIWVVTFCMFFGQLASQHIDLAKEAERLGGLAYTLRYLNADSAILMADKAFELAVVNNFEEEIAYNYYVRSVIMTYSENAHVRDSFLQLSLLMFEAQNNMAKYSMARIEQANILWNMGELDSAKQIYQEALKLKLSIADMEGVAIIYGNLGAIADIKGNYESAINYQLKASHLHDSLGDVTMSAAAQHNLSIIYHNLGRYSEAIQSQYQALRLNHQAVLPTNICFSHICLANYFIPSGQLDSASAHAKKALILADQIDFPQGRLYAYSVLADIAVEQGLFEEALGYLNGFLDIFPSNGDPFMLSSIKMKKGQVMSLLGHHDVASQWILESMPVFENMGAQKEVMEANSMLAEINESKGDYKEALRRLKIASVMKDSLISKDRNQDIAELETKYQVEKNELKTAKLQIEKDLADERVLRRNRTLIGTLIGLLGLSIAVMLLYLQSKKRKTANRKIANQRDQIQLLNRELNHRVKNNLAFMTSLLEMQGRRSQSTEAKDVLRESETRLHALSLVHSNLFKNNADTELNLKNYLEEICQHLKDIFELPNKSLVINTQFADFTMDAEDAMRVGLVVNELVTNSVKHAFGQVDEPTVIIETKVIDHVQIQLSYKDNGPGLTSVNLTELHTKNPNSLGTKLIQLLCLQLDGKMKLNLG